MPAPRPSPCERPHVWHKMNRTPRQTLSLSSGEMESCNCRRMSEPQTQSFSKNWGEVLGIMVSFGQFLVNRWLGRISLEQTQSSLGRLSPNRNVTCPCGLSGLGTPARTQFCASLRSRGDLLGAPWAPVPPPRLTRAAGTKARNPVPEDVPTLSRNWHIGELVRTSPA